MARILIVDDEEQMRRLVERVLGERYSCELAADVPEAREKLAGGTFELALCDIQMPGEPGLVLLEELAAEHPDTAAVLVTGVDDPEVAERSLELGAYGYLVKPFRPGQLLITTMNALRRRELELAQQAHARSLEERLQAIIDRAPMPIYAKNGEHRYVIANRSATEMSALGPGGLVGLTDDDIMSPASAQRAQSSDRNVIERGEVYEVEETMNVAGEDRVFLTTKFPLMDDEHGVFAAGGISVDVTATHEAERLSRELAETQERAIEELQSSRLETVERLTRAIELHDPGTGEHINRMASIAAFLGSRAGLDRERTQLLRAAAPMHDVGKIGIAEGVLTKPGALTSGERSEMERHTIIGHELLAESKSDLLRLAAEIALTHHEKFDGSGYPRGLEGDAIPLEGRIVAVADVFDALISDRSYRRAMPVAKAVAIIEEGRGSHFDPRIADLLLENIEEALSYRG